MVINLATNFSTKQILNPRMLKIYASFKLKLKVIVLFTGIYFADTHLQKSTSINNYPSSFFRHHYQRLKKKKNKINLYAIISLNKSNKEPSTVMH